MDIEAGDERVRASGSRSRPPLPHGGVSIRRSCCRHRYLRWPCTTRAHMRERTHSMREHILWGGPALQVHTCERIRTRCSADVRERENSVCIGCSLGVHWVFIVRTTGTAMGVPEVVRTCVHAHVRACAMCACTHACMYAHAYMLACARACMLARARASCTRIHARMRMHANTHACMHVRTCTHPCMHVCVCVCVCVRSQELRERAAAMQ